jgi:hypothetical protein
MKEENLRDRQSENVRQADTVRKIFFFFYYGNARMINRTALNKRVKKQDTRVIFYGFCITQVRLI